MSIVGCQKLTSRDSDFANHPGDGKHVWLGVLSFLAVWAILFFGGWRIYICTSVCFALFMAFLNRGELAVRISTAVRNWRATQKQRV